MDMALAAAFSHGDARVVGLARERQASLPCSCSMSSWRWACWPRGRWRRFWRRPSSCSLHWPRANLALSAERSGCRAFCCSARSRCHGTSRCRCGIRNFFANLFLQHNLARFSSDLYHHRQPFWYYLPVTALALVPWTVFVIAALVQPVRIWWAERKSVSPEPDLEWQFSLFACCWLVVPVVFFSISQSKLPGYILPAIPAGAVLLADYLRRQLEQEDSRPSRRDWRCCMRSWPRRRSFRRC